MNPNTLGGKILCPLVGCLLIVMIFFLTIHPLVVFLSFVYQSGAFQHEPSTNQCQNIFSLTPITTYYRVQPEEADFPLAFNILVFTDLERAVRLLRAIYRPQNSYCIHVDKKSTKEYVRTLKIAATCFGNNVFLVPDSERRDVRWGEISILEAELICFKVLMKSGRNWKYLINLTGQEFPLRTNWELVVALKALNGSNLVAATYKRRNMWRVPPPKYSDLKVTYYKGSVHVAVRREFVNFTLYDQRAIKLLKALRDYERDKGHRIITDETYFATLNHNPVIFPIPGAFLGEHEVGTVTRAKIWQDGRTTCGSKVWIRTVCMFGIADLPFLIKSEKFFANKFRVHVEPEAYDILEQWIESKVRYEAERGHLHPSFNLSVYAKNEFAWNHM
ncbi:unnamed protein product [Calicophoron daubneyi]|uniref:Beta-1,3-galactosyl-O-glycosyl-glycoprotein beta-1,6-N-acetylglucosaminyltransferase n=1 Tax=Calicophoron daubneyi TaxID=300641 RepID=A0AAV2TH50_CALDB